MHTSRHALARCLPWIGGLALVLLGGCADAPPRPLPVTVATGDVGVPTTAVDARDGTVYWTWFGKEDGLTNVYLARLDPGRATPDAPARVNQVPGNANRHDQAPAQVALGPDGTVYVAWTNRIDVDGRRFPASNLLLARSTDGGRTFAPPVTVNDDAGELPSGHTFHNLIVSPDGTLYVSWLDSRARDRAQAARAVAPGDHASPAGMADDLPGTELRVARSTDGGRTFAAGIVAARGTCQCCRTALAVGPGGTLYLAWRHIFPGGARDMAVVRSDDGGLSFSEPVRVHEDAWIIEACPHSGPSLVADAQGRVHVAWYTGVEGGDGVFYAVSDDGGRRFGAPVPLVTGVPVSQVSLVEARGSGVWVAWDDWRAGVIRTARAEPAALRRASEAEGIVGERPVQAVGGRTHVLTWVTKAAIAAHVVRSG